MTKLLTKAQATRMRANWNGPERDHKPVVKLFHPASAATWLLTNWPPTKIKRLACVT